MPAIMQTINAPQNKAIVMSSAMDTRPSFIGAMRNISPVNPIGMVDAWTVSIYDYRCGMWPLRCVGSSRLEVGNLALEAKSNRIRRIHG